jgi:hypothetical protein
MADRDDDNKPGGLLSMARRLARAAVTRAVERLTGMPLSGDPWATPKKLPTPPAPPAPPARPARPAPVARPAAAPATKPPAAKPAPITTAGPTAKPSSIPTVDRKPRTPASKAPSPTRAATPAPGTKAVPIPAPAPLPPPPAEPEEPFGILDYAEPPETYGLDEVFVTFRDPGTLFCWWEVTPSAWERARAELGGDGRLVLRLDVTDGEGHAWTVDEPLSWDHGRRYLAAPAPGGHVAGAVGVLAPDGRFARMAGAAPVHVPPGVPGPDEPIDWMEVARGDDHAPNGAALPPPRVVHRGPGRELAGAGGGRWIHGVWHRGTGRVPVPGAPDSGALHDDHALPHWSPLGASRAWPTSPARTGRTS